MSDKLRRRLSDELRPDIEKLSALVDRDPTHWVAQGVAPAERADMAEH